MCVTVEPTPGFLSTHEHLIQRSPDERPIVAGRNSSSGMAKTILEIRVVDTFPLRSLEGAETRSGQVWKGGGGAELVEGMVECGPLCRVWSVQRGVSWSVDVPNPFLSSPLDRRRYAADSPLQTTGSLAQHSRCRRALPGAAADGLHGMHAIWRGSDPQSLTAPLRATEHRYYCVESQSQALRNTARFR